MTSKRIKRNELARFGESQIVELKKSLSSKKDAMKALNGMVNTDGAEGTVIFGVAPDGNPVGVEGDIDRHQQSLADKKKKMRSGEISK